MRSQFENVSPFMMAEAHDIKFIFMSAFVNDLSSFIEYVLLAGFQDEKLSFEAQVATVCFICIQGGAFENRPLHGKLTVLYFFLNSKCDLKVQFHSNG